MIKLENYEVVGWEHALRGMRNPMNSWDRADSKTVNAVLKRHEICPGVVEDAYEPCEPYFSIGLNDGELAMKLAKGGPVHAKYRRMIEVYVDITAPLYWWKEFDTYKVGTVSNSCSTMHKIQDKEFTLEDFSCEHLITGGNDNCWVADHDEYLLYYPIDILTLTIDSLNECRRLYLITKDKKYWWQMIQLLPSSYNQRRTIKLNYEVLANIYKWRKNHKLDEWCEFCKWIETLPYSELITLNTGNEEVAE
jgi:hypothetical protein